MGIIEWITTGSAVDFFADIGNGVIAVLDFFDTLKEILLIGIRMLPSFLQVMASTWLVVFIALIVYKAVRG